MPVGIANQRAGGEAERRLRHVDRARRHERHAVRARQRQQRIERGRGQRGLPVADVVGALIGGGRTSVTRCQVLQQLDAGPVLRAQRRDPEPRAENVVEVFLLDVVVLALSRNGETERVAIEAQ